jgi:DNA repair protein RecO (recombination protein O)
MPIPRRYTTEAIVLSRFDLGEADRVLTLITPGIGKLKAIAKGVRRPTSRLGGSLEPFAELTVALARGRTFDVVTQVSVGHAWLNLRDSLESAATAWYLAELAEHRSTLDGIITKLILLSRSDRSRMCTATVERAE